MVKLKLHFFALRCLFKSAIPFNQNTNIAVKLSKKLELLVGKPTNAYIQKSNLEKVAFLLLKQCKG
jgi:hypothetical protein